jgi:biopolymer transport protein ExbD
VMTHAVKIDLPRDNPNPPTEPPPVVKVYVEFDGTIYWNGAPVDQQTFRDYVAIENAKDPQPEIHVDAHRRVPYVYVANVLFTLQRGGLQKVGFVSGEGAPAEAPAPAP